MQMTYVDGPNGARFIALDGRLDVSGVDAVEPSFTEAARGGTGAVAVDMSQVSFVASLGLRMFVAVGRALRADGRPFVLHSCQPPVAEVFEIAALDDLIQIAPNEGAAHARLG